MIRRTAGLAALLAFLSPSAALAGQEEPGSSSGRPDVQVRGVVVDQDTGRPVSGADVELDPEAAPEITGEGGGFYFELAPGAYLLRITRIGYRSVADTLELAPGTRARIRAEMVPEAVGLEPLVVLASRRTLLEEVGFYQRRRTGLGSFMTRDDIERRRPTEFTDLVRTLPGLRAESAGQFGDQVLRMRGDCVPTLFVDGLRTLDGLSPDLILQPDQVEGIEVYRGAQVPVEYGRETCGAVVVWTRQGEPGPEGASFWKRVGIVAGFLLLVGLQLR